MSGRPLVLIWLVALLSAAAVVVPETAEAAFPGPNGTIVFARGGELYTINGDGSGLTNLTNTPGVFESSPAWSPDGTRIAFLSNGRQSGSNSDLYIMNRDGSNAYRVAQGPGCGGAPNWSPSGQQFVYSSCTSQGAAVWKINIDGSGRQQLTDGHTSDTDPVWSPDGSRIAFGRSDSNLSNIYVMNPDGTGQSPVTSNPLFATARMPDWSPDGTKIVYSGGGSGSDPNTVNDIYTVEATGANQTRLTSGAEWDLNPAWSPDGTKIVFVRSSGCPFACSASHLWTISPDGTNATQITADPASDGTPDWGTPGVLPPPPPDQPGRIAFSSARDMTSESSVLDAQEIYTMNPDGTGVRRLTQNHVADTDPAWSADGTRIAFDSARTPAGIYTMNAGGSNQTFLGAGTSPSWPPDGTQIVFSDTGELTVMNADGSNRIDLQVRGGDPSWSPDGARIALSMFTQDVPGGQDIYTIASDGSNLTRVTTNPRDENLPAWSSDGERIAFERVEPEPNQTMRPNIWTVAPDGSDEHQVTAVTTDVGARHPTWSPDNSMIAYWADGAPGSGNNEEIYAINADGSGSPSNLTNSPPLNAWFNRFPAWQPIVVPGGFPRPKGATPLRVSLVPAFASCGSPNRTHGAPLAFGSCAPPQQASTYLTVGTPDANGAQPNSVASERIDVLAGNPATPADEADVRFNVSVTDVRNQSGLSDYTGELRAVHTLRLTDRASSGPAAATVQDLPLAFSVQCVRQPPSGIGASCAATTTADAVVPGAVSEGKRSIWAFAQVQVYDGGADADADTTGDNTLFLTQGVFVP